MRTDQSDCLLCLTNKASKTNSHIVPKFLTKNILGLGNFKRGYTIGTDRSDKPPIYEQDSPKESYILCPECEAYFSILETYININFHRKLWDAAAKGDFKDEVTVGGVKFKSCIAANPKIFHLFLYSILWRCSITNDKLFENFKLADYEEEGLRSSLLKFKSLTNTDLLKSIGTIVFDLFPSKFALLSCETFSDETKNMIAAPPGNKNPYFLVLNQYMILVSFNENEKQNLLDEINNIVPSETHIKTGLFKEETWSAYLNSFTKIFVKKAIEKLEEDGKKPFLLDEEDLKGL